MRPGEFEAFIRWLESQTIRHYGQPPYTLNDREVEFVFEWGTPRREAPRPRGFVEVLPGRSYGEVTAKNVGSGRSPGVLKVDALRKKEPPPGGTRRIGSSS